MTDTQIAIKERINESRAKQRNFFLREQQRALEVRHLIRMQADLEDDILILECELAKEKAL